MPKTNIPKPKASTLAQYDEIENIREDLDSLKSNIVELTKHIAADGNEQAQELKERALDQIAALQNTGLKQYKSFEKSVKSNPGQSVAMAFAAGLALSLLLRRG